jgi:hypothetical protein
MTESCKRAPDERRRLTLIELINDLRRAANIYFPPENIMDLEELLRRCLQMH